MQRTRARSRSIDADPVLAALGRRVRQLRGARRLTLAGLAERAGLSARFLHDLETGRGNISLKNLAAVAGALEVRLPELLDDRGSASAERSSLLAECLALADEDLVEAHRVVAGLRARRGARRRFDKTALIGLRGAGKTSIGRAVARRMKVPFVELDRRVEELAGMRLADLFAIHGEPYYRRLELQTVEEIARQPGRAIIAAGGGIVGNADAYDLLRSSCLTVWLEAAPADHWNRVLQQGDQRPMKGNPRAMAELETLLDQRRPLYGRAHLRVDTSALGLEKAIDEVRRLAASG